MPIFFFEFEAQPHPTHSLATELGGAFVCCWVKAEDIRSARERCEQELKADAWIVSSEERAFESDRALLHGNEDEIAMYDQAEAGGFGCIRHTWPNEPQDEQPIH